MCDNEKKAKQDNKKYIYYRYNRMTKAEKYSYIARNRRLR